jgi:hypothetical protein
VSVGHFVNDTGWHARKWFTGPRIQGSAEELAAIGADLRAVK